MVDGGVIEEGGGTAYCKSDIQENGINVDFFKLMVRWRRILDLVHSWRGRNVQYQGNIN